jgi:hypothetical protein
MAVSRLKLHKSFGGSKQTSAVQGSKEFGVCKHPGQTKGERCPICGKTV